MTVIGTRIDPRSIRVYLAVLAIVAALPLAALVVHASVGSYQGELRRGELEGRRLAEITAASTVQLLAHTRAILEGTAGRFTDGLGDSTECSKTLAEAYTLAPHLANLVATDAQGIVRCSALALPTGSPPDLSRSNMFIESASGSPFTVAPPMVSLIVEEWVVVVAVPIHDADGAFVGVVAAGIPLVRLQSLLAGAEIGDDDLVTIANENRIVLARSKDPESYVGRELPPDTAVVSFVGPDRYFTGGTDMQGVARTWSTMQIPAVGWTVFAGIPAERVLAPARAALRGDLMLGMLSLLLAGVLAYAVQRSISDSLVNVIELTRAGGRGQPAAPPNRGPSELRTVGSHIRESFEARSRAEESERVAKERYRAILNNAVFGIGVTSHDGRFVEANPALAAMLGYGSVDELRAVRGGDLYADPEARPALARSIEETGVLKDQEIGLLRRDGTEIVVRLNGRKADVSLDAAYEIVVEDITGQKELEAALRHSQKIEAVGQLAGGIAHDFNNLLTVIAGNTDLLLAQMPADDPFRPDVLEISEATDRAEGVTQQLLSLSRKGRLERRAVDVNDVIARFDSILGRLIGEHITVSTSLAENLPAVQADPAQIEQVLLNLAVNARDAMPKGGTLSIETYYSSARPDSGPPTPGSGWVCVAVEDTGVGMNEEVRDRVFEPYYTTKPVGAGTGLGLATAYANVAEMGGMLSVTSTEGKGTRFEMWLGLAKPTAGAKDAAALDPDQLPGGTESVLVVEDETGLRRFVQRVLESAGYDVTVAEDGAVAIDLIESGKQAFDLVLTDLVMPKRSGTDVVEVVRARDPDAAILLMSGYSAGLPVEPLIGNETDLLMRKPFSISVLRTRVRWALDRRPIRRADDAPRPAARP